MYAVRPQWPPIRAFWCKNLKLVWSGSSRVGAVGPPRFCVTGLFPFERVANVWQRGTRRLRSSGHTAGCADPRPR